MKLRSILKNINYETDADISELDIKMACINTKCIIPSSLFISLRGDRDAETEAIRLGAAAILCSGGARWYNVPVILTDNIREAYAVACYNLADINSKKIKFVGVTGTNGKTSISKIIYSVLNKNGIKSGFIGTGKIETPDEIISSDFYSSTTPDPHILYPAIKKMEEGGCKYVVMEVSSHALFYSKVVPLKFEVSVFSNLSAEHMDFHKNMQDYYDAKKKISELSELIVINKDDKYGRMLENEVRCNHVTVGVLWNDADVKVKNINISGFSGIDYTYYGKDFCFIAKSKLCGAVNVYNTALAITALNMLHLTPKDIKRALYEIDGIDGRFEKISDSPTVILDYAHTPEGLESFMRSIKSFSGTRKITLIFGCGGERDKTKRPVMAKIAEIYADNTIITSDNPRGESPKSIISDIVSGFSIFANYTIIENRENAINCAIENSDDDEIIALVGKGAEKYYIDKDGYHTFSDKACALNAIAEKESRRENKTSYTDNTH